jgi:hypothetical protein
MILPKFVYSDGDKDLNTTIRIHRHHNCFVEDKISASNRVFGISYGMACIRVFCLQI